MKERPILFQGPMVRALLAGTKTQTRRVVKPQPPEECGPIDCGRYHPTIIDRHGDEQPGPEIFGAYDAWGQWGVRCPYGQPGDRLWVREAWKAHTTFDQLPPRDIPHSHVWYMADDGYKAESRYRQGMFMPRWASRITLEITAVRVEKLQDISEADAIAEGCSLECMTPTGDDSGSAIHGPGGYIALWESINGPGSWDVNPWLWVVEFKRVTP